MTHRRIAVLFTAVVLTVAAATARAAEPADVQVRTSLDRTAIWIADHVTYTVTIVCKPNVDVLDDDLSRDKLKLDGLELLSADSGRETAADGTTTRRFRYTVTTYRVDVPELKIAPLSVRYYVKRPGQRLQDAAPAGEAPVPGAVIPLRSTLPDQQDTAVLRDAHPVAQRASVYTLAQPVGLGLVIASIAPVAFWGAAIVARNRHRIRRRSVRQVRSEERATLEATRDLDVTTTDGRREAYTRINAVVREHLTEVCRVPGSSLTPGEVGPVLTSSGSRVPPETVAALLAECERARYAPPDALPSPDACRDALAQAEQVLAIR